MGGNSWRATAAAALALLLVACSGSDGPGESASTAASVVTSTEVPSTTTEAPTTPPTTTEPPVEMVPAGVQFSGAESLPGTVEGSRGGVARDGVLYIPASYVTDAYNGYHGAGVIVRHPDGSSEFRVIDDNSGYNPAPGFPIVRGFTVGSIASGPTGLVAVGISSFYADLNISDATVQSLIWFSPDGVTWQRIDPRDATGQVPLTLSDVTATPTGFIAVGSTADSYDADSSKSEIVVLGSDDGITWRALPKISAQWSVDGGSVGIVGDEIVVTGVQFACTVDSLGLYSFSRGAQFRIWHSADDGATWSTITGPDTGLASEPEPAPTDPAACPSRDDLTAFYSAVDERFSGGGPAGAAITDLGLVILEAETDRVGVSTDLVNWTVADSLGRAAAADGARAARVFVQGDELVITVAGPIENQSSALIGNQIYNWRSADVGETWTALPLGRPLPLPKVGQVEILPADDDAVAVVNFISEQSIGSNTLYLSVAGEYVEPGLCTPTAGADCAFATSLTTTDLSGMDLTGIDLRGAELGDEVSFDGANLTGAMLDGADIEATFGSADLTMASLRGADLEAVDLSAANLTGTVFEGTKVDTSLFRNPTFRAASLVGIQVFLHDQPFTGMDFSGLDLTNVDFGNFSDAPVAMTGSTFTDTILIGAGFAGVDLTGVDLTTAVLANGDYQQASFYKTICPDGMLSTDTFDLASCRLG